MPMVRASVCHDDGYTEGGLRAIHQILQKTEASKLRRKCLTLLADLIQLGDLSITDHGPTVFTAFVIKD